MQRLDPAYELPISLTDGDPGGGLMTLGELYVLPTVEHEWVVSELLPAGGLCLLVAKPKVGKSSLIRELIRSIVLGEPFLNRETQAGPVIYFALEELKSKVKEFFVSMDLPETAPLLVAFEKAVCPDLETMRNYIKQHTPKLIIIDTMIRFVEVDDLNDYAKVSKQLGPVANLCRETGVAMVLAHHARKADGDDSGDSALGSTAIFGTVDTLMRLRKDADGNRRIDSEQRYGTSLEPTLIHYDRDTHRVTLGSTVKAEGIKNMEEKILMFLGKEGATQPELMAAVKSPRLYTQLRLMVEAGTLEKIGTGKKGDPFTYRCRGKNALSPTLSI